MTILVVEYITGGGLATESLPVELAREGEVIVNAKLKDLANRSLMLLRDWRLPAPAALPRCQAAELMPVRDFARAWQAALAQAEMVWLTAPETGGVLMELSCQVLAAGKKLLGASPQAVRLAGDKLATLGILMQAGVECVPGWLIKDFTAQVPPPWVVKPRDGVGCEGAALVKDWGELACFPEDFLLQPWVAGEPMSLSVLFAGGEAVLLSVNRQVVQNREGGFALLGCEVNVSPHLDGYLQALCQRIASAVPGLWGYAGVDFIMTATGARVLEINPRLTLSYAGLSEALGRSVGEWIVDLATGKASLSEIASCRKQLVSQTVWVSA